MPQKSVIRLIVFLLLLTGVLADPRAGRAADRRSIDLIVRGDYVVTMDPARPVLRDGAVAIDKGVILAVDGGSAITARYRGAEDIGGADRVVLPGLVNGHTHAAMVLFRGLADDLDLMTWLNTYIFPMEARFVDPDFIHTGMALACWEMIRGGTTTFLDMYFYPDVGARVVVDCGLRAIIAAPMIDFPSPGFKGWDDSLAAGLAFVKRWKGRSGRITPALAPHAAYTVSPEHLKAVGAAAAAFDVPLTIHVAEDRAEVAEIAKRYGTSTIRHLAGLGLLGPRLIAAHVVWPQTGYLALLAQNHVGVIHNPTSNLKVGAGIAPVPAMLNAGVAVGLGTDGAASNNDLDMWGELRLAALIHKGVSGDPTVMPAATVLRMATLGGAAAIGLSRDIGSLTVGKRADVIQLALDTPRLTPLYNILSHLVYVAGARDVVTTIVDGRVLMRNRKVLTLDAAKVRADARAIAARIRARLDETALEGARQPETKP